MTGIPMPSSKPVTAREILEASANVLNNNWVSGDWFVMEWPEGTEFHSEGWNDDEPVDPTVKQEVVGVCLAGGVLYSLGYTDESYVDQAEVKPVINLIFEALVENVFKPLEETSGVNVNDPDPDRRRFTVGGWSEYQSVLWQTENGDDAYDEKVSAIVNWNDDVSRKKEEVIDILKDATKRSIERGL